MTSSSSSTPSTTTTSSSYTRPSEYTRSSTSTAIKSAGDETKDRKTSISYSRTPSNTKLTNDDAEKEKPKTYTRSYSSISDFKSESSSTAKPTTTNGVRKEPEVPQRTSFRSRLSRDSVVMEKSKTSEKGPPITFNTRYKTILPGRSRDPSPSLSSSAKDQTLSTLNGTKDKLSKYTSSLTSSSKDGARGGERTKSRDPSPSVSSSRRGSQTSATQTALQRISAYRERSKSREPSPSASRSRSKNQAPIITLSSQNRSREASPLAQKLSQLTAEFDSLQKLVARSREASQEPAVFISPRSHLASSYSREQSPEKYYNNTSRKPSITATTTTAAAPTSATTTLLSTNHNHKNKEDIHAGEGKTSSSSTSRRSSREWSPLEQIKSRFSQQYTTPSKPSVAGLSGSNNDMTSSYSKDSAFPASRISFINRRSPEKVKSPPVAAAAATLSKTSGANNLMKTSEQSVKDIKTSEIDKDKNDDDNNDNDNSDKEDDDESSTSCSTSTKTPSSTSESTSKQHQSTSVAHTKKSPSPPKTKIFIQVRTITRATSPNSKSGAGGSSSGSSTSSLTRLRRAEIAKTVEKVRQRPLIGPQMVDKATQSDRLDDSARRYAASSSSSSVYSTYSMRNSPAASSGKYSSKFSREIELSEAKEREKQRADSSSCLSIDSLSIPSSNNHRGTSSISSRSSISAEKSRSSTPQTTYQSDSANVKCENNLVSKDYRKSTLNMGPTNRSLRSTSSSSMDNPSSSVKETRKQLQQMFGQDEFARDKSRGVESENSEIECNLEVKNITSGRSPANEPSREEKINQKIEEAKEFLIKTLGNKNDFSHSTQYKSPSPPPSPAPPTPPSFNKSSSSASSIVSNNNQNHKEEKADINGNYEIITEASPNNHHRLSELCNEVNNTNSISSNSKYSWMENNNKLNDCLKKIERVDSGEKPWWCQSPSSNDADDNDDDKVDEDITIAADVQLVNNGTTTSSELKASNERESSITYADVDVDKHENSIECRRRMSPEGVEASSSSPHGIESNSRAADNLIMNNFADIEHNQFISKHRNIDDLLGKMRKVVSATQFMIQ